MTAVAPTLIGKSLLQKQSNHLVSAFIRCVWFAGAASRLLQLHHEADEAWGRLLPSRLLWHGSAIFPTGLFTSASRVLSHMEAVMFCASSCAKSWHLSLKHICCCGKCPDDCPPHPCYLKPLQRLVPCFRTKCSSTGARSMSAWVTSRLGYRTSSPMHRYCRLYSWLRLTLSIVLPFSQL